MQVKKKESQKRTTVRNGGECPAQSLPELIPDTPENIARTCTAGPTEEAARVAVRC